jgi:hypothetical protein
MNIEIVIFSVIVFIVFLGLISYGAALEEKYRKLKQTYDDLEDQCQALIKEKEQGK